MLGLVITLHVFISILLIGAVLLQPGAKGGGLGATFGGGGANSAFGAQGAAPFLAKLTYWLAGGFLLCSLGIEMLIIKGSKSVFEQSLQSKPAAAAPAPTSNPPAAPATPTQPATK